MAKKCVKGLCGLTVRGLFALIIFLLILTPAFSQPLPGTTYNQTNYQELEGFALEPMVNWVKEGKLPVKVGELNFSQWKKTPGYIKASIENKDRYTINETNILVHKNDGSVVNDIYGYPFSEIDADDPLKAQKLVENGLAARYSMRAVCTKSVNYNFNINSLHNRSESLSGFLFYQQHPKGVLENPKGFLTQSYTLITQPFEMKGLCVISHIFAEDKEDTSYAYVPQLRRIIRTSSAARSEGVTGGELSLDDFAGWGGKNSSMNWRYLGKHQMLMPVTNTVIVPMDVGEDGSYPALNTKIKLGYTEKGFKGAPWAPLNVTWVLRDLHAIEMTPKDPKYNYGKAVLYVDAENYFMWAKTIFDRDMNYFKTVFLYASHRVGVKDGFDQVGYYDGYIVVNDKANTASIVQLTSEGSRINLPVKKLSAKDFSVQSMVRRSK